MKTNTLWTATSTIDDVMPAIVRVPVDAVKPGFMSVCCEKLADVIADTTMVPGAETIAGAPPAADDTAASITKPANVWVITLNVPAA